MIRALAIAALVPPAASLYFPLFWCALPFWRRHAALAYVMMLATIAAVLAIAIVWRDPLLAPAIEPPLALQIAGWAIVAASFVLGTIADRQLGLYVRSFAPLFEERGRIELRTTGAYAIVRHPIYAAGAWFQLGMLLVTGALSIAIALVVFVAGAAWFTRREERQLRELLADPAAYDRYRARVGGLIPNPYRSTRARS